jgi:hypothetical protein
MIPEVWKIDSPKNKKVWYDFKSYKDIRDRLVHVKTVDQRALGQQADDLWGKLFIQHDYLSPEVVKKLISYYYDRKKENTPDWYKNFPYKI